MFRLVRISCRSPDRHPQMECRHCHLKYQRLRRGSPRAQLLRSPAKELQNKPQKHLFKQTDDVAIAVVYDSIIDGFEINLGGTLVRVA